MSLRFDAASLSLGGSRILQPLSLQLAQGEQVALIGPSGAGKSSLLLLANSCHRPDGGSVQLLGQDPVYSIRLLLLLWPRWAPRLGQNTAGPT